jgi:lysophospholipase L1-like esterase
MDVGDRFEYANLVDRPHSPLVTAAGRVIPGIAVVQRQIEPYATSWQQANRQAIVRPGPRWVVLGDSMSQGVGASGFDAGWVNQLHDRLTQADRHYEIVNLSASGARVSDVLERQIPAWLALPAAPRVSTPLNADTGAGRRPDLVTVLIGSNDLLRKRYRRELSARFAELLALLPDDAVVANLPQPRQAATEVNELLDRAREERGLVVVDMRGGRISSWRGKLAEDHFHPNDQGYAGIADTFFAAIAAS